jgi:hypothetical protein
MTGYTKEKSQKLEKQHEARAEQLEREAREAEQSETFQRGHSAELRKEAQAEREKAENQRALQKHWGDR